MQWLNGTYAQQFNRRHGRWGHLCGARYSCGAVESERHMLRAFRYIALNPVSAGLCHHPRDWPRSSYSRTARYDESFSLVADHTIRDFFGPDLVASTELLRAFVEEAVTVP
jgi:hypothetical protein